MVFDVALNNIQIDLLYAAHWKKNNEETRYRIVEITL